jgi:hypothetical protein
VAARFSVERVNAMLLAALQPREGGGHRSSPRGPIIALADGIP